MSPRVLLIFTCLMSILARSSSKMNNPTTTVEFMVDCNFELETTKSVIKIQLNGNLNVPRLIHY